MPPVIRSPARVRYGDDTHGAVSNLVDDGVRESRHENLPDRRAARPWCAAFGVRSNLFDSRADGAQEFRAEARALLLVPANGLGEILRSRIAELKRRHRPRISFSIRRFTESQGSRRAVPASIAATRRSISASQAASAPGSAGPAKLANNSAANSARAGASSRKASANTTWVGFVMIQILRSDTPANKRLQPTARVSSCERSQERARRG